ncbi:hypothetical protein [Streptomyces sp. NPDC058394]|uniref:hypothetical protein n=1 Tax=Streptomyces sp. NPDC058394 TaxID=3346477 RepID=UPI0036629FDA
MTSKHQQQSFDYRAEVAHAEASGMTEIVTGIVIAATRREALQRVGSALRARGLEPLDVTLSEAP